MESINQRDTFCCVLMVAQFKRTEGGERKLWIKELGISQSQRCKHGSSCLCCQAEYSLPTSEIDSTNVRYKIKGNKDFFFLFAILRLIFKTNKNPHYCTVDLLVHFHV